MCIGIPMQVESIGLALAMCRRQGTMHRVCTALVGNVAVGDWLLVFIDTATEVISADRAAEVLAMLAMLERSTRGGGTEEAVFALPSSVSRERLLALTSGS